MKSLVNLAAGVFFGLIPPLVNSQTISGRVIDENTSDPIPYVNIGVLNGHRGTVSDESGLFVLNLEGLADPEIVRFSFIGYEPLDLPVGSANTLTAGTVTLRPMILEMQEVLVFPRAFEEKRVGNPNPPKFIRAGFSHDSLGYELGVLIRIKNRPTVLKEFHLHGLAMSYDSVFYRLNVYEMDGDRPGKNVLRNPIYFTLTQDEIVEDLTVDLKPYHIVVQDDFVVTLEYVRDLGEGSLQMGAGFLNGKTFYRRTSQDRWYDSPIGAGMSVLIRYPQKP